MTDHQADVATPRTDAQTFTISDGTGQRIVVVHASLSRTLERELTAANATIAELRQQLAAANAATDLNWNTIIELRNIIDEQENQLAAAQADNVRLRDRVERLRGMLKTCAGWCGDETGSGPYGAEWLQRLDLCMEVAGDMEGKLDRSALDDALTAEREICIKAVYGAGGDNTDYHCDAIRALGAGDCS